MQKNQKSPIVTSVGPDQQDKAQELAREHAMRVAQQLGQKRPEFVRGTIEPTIKK